MYNTNSNYSYQPQYYNTPTRYTTKYSSNGCNTNNCNTNVTSDPCAKPCTPNPNPNKVTNCCCNSQIKKVLCAIRNCVNQYSNIPGFGVSLIITLDNGSVYNANIDAGVLNPVTITDSIFQFNKMTISICDISKIEIVTGSITNADFLNCLNTNLCNLTGAGSGGCSCGCNCNCNCGCGNSTCGNSNCMAMTIDDGSDELALTSDKDCCCEGEIEKQLVCNSTIISTLGYSGAVNNIQSIPSLDQVVFSTVVNSATVSSTTVPVVSNVTLTNTTATIVAPTSVLNVSVVNALATQATTVVTDVTVTNATVLSDVTSTPVTVVSSVTLSQPATLVNSVTAGTGVVAAPLSSTDLSVVTNITSVPFAPVIDATITTTNAVDPLDIDTTNAVTNLGTPDTVSVVSGITSVATVNTTTVTNVVVAPTLVLGGVVEVVVPADAFGDGIPPNPYTLVASIGGATLVLGNPTTIVGLVNAATLLDVTGTPAVSDVVTGYNAPVTEPVLIAPNGINPITVANGLTLTTISATGIGTITSETINNIATPTTLAVVTTVTSTTTAVTGVSSVATVVVNSLNTTVPTQVIQSVTSTTQSINAVSISTTTSVGSVISSVPTTVVTALTLTSTTTPVVNNVTATITNKSVVSNLTTKTVNVLAPTAVTITGSISCVGNGLMIVKETNSNISVYSLCKVNAFTTN